MDKRGDLEFHQTTEEVTEEKLWNHKNIFLAVILGVVVLLIFVSILFLRNSSTNEAVTLGLATVALYAVILFFLLEPQLIKEVRKGYVQTIEKPVIQQVQTTVEKPVIQEVRTPVYIPVKTKVPQGKRYKFVASTETKLFHPSSSRLSRLIRPKNRIYGDNPSEFTRKGYKPSEKAKEFIKSSKKSSK